MCDACEYFSDRPESRLTEASECSSTISSSDDGKERDSGDVSESILTPSPEPTKSAEDADRSVVTQDKTKRRGSSAGASSGDSADTSTLVGADSPNSSTPNLLPRRSPSFTATSTPVRRPVSRSNSVTGEDGCGLSRSRPGSQRSTTRPAATSRYMQAAEAYTARSRAQKTSNATTTPGRKTPELWGRRRVPDIKYATTGRVRTASASPAPHQREALGGHNTGPAGPIRRERTFGGGGESGRTTPVARPTAVSSTQSTPSRRPNPRVALASQELAAVADEEGDSEDALKRMEEILMSLKSRVEDRLAAEGQELPKDIFEDFTSQWVSEATSALVKEGGTTPAANRSRNPSGSSV
jgi:hypothetical protein